MLERVSVLLSFWYLNIPLYSTTFCFSINQFGSVDGHLGCSVVWSGEGNGNPLQYSCLGNPMDRGDWQAPRGHKESDTAKQQLLSFIVNNAAMNICVYVFSFLLSIYLPVDLEGHMVTLCLTYWGVAKMFYKVAAPCYISTSSQWGFQFHQILTNTCNYRTFWL